MSKPIYDRQFLGKIKDFIDKDEQKFENAHLRAYLKGYEKFTYGFEQVPNPITGLMETRPKWHDVQQSLSSLDIPQ